MVTEIIQNDAHNDDTDKLDIQTVQKKKNFVVHTIRTIYDCKTYTARWAQGGDGGSWGVSRTLSSRLTRVAHTHSGSASAITARGARWRWRWGKLWSHWDDELPTNTDNTIAHCLWHTISQLAMDNSRAIRTLQDLISAGWRGTATEYCLAWQTANLNSAAQSFSTLLVREIILVIQSISFCYFTR